MKIEKIKQVLLRFYVHMQCERKIFDDLMAALKSQFCILEMQRRLLQNLLFCKRNSVVC